ncbi:MAG: histidine phosphatase family protein [Planctomycetota bacterium]|nr:MAG: histidine phosphatase family protein [Planctomycetota bacterium]
MARTLYLLRHAKSDWGGAALADADRPLNARGRRDAPRMARALARLSPAPAHVICSPAVRTRQTLDLIQQTAAIDAPIVFDDRVYEAPVGALLDAIADAPDVAPAVLLIGHNPGVQGLIRAITGRDVRVPTATLAKIEIDADSWSGLAPGAGRLEGVWRPKEIDDE